MRLWPSNEIPVEGGRATRLTNAQVNIGVLKHTVALGVDVSPTEFIAPRFADRFACIGALCEDSCCHHWRIDVDKDHHQLLQAAMSETEAERQEFASAVRLNDPKDAHRHAPWFCVWRYHFGGDRLYHSIAFVASPSCQCVFDVSAAVWES